VSVPDR